jgi:hypothetical protein
VCAGDREFEVLIYNYLSGRCRQIELKFQFSFVFCIRRKQIITKVVHTFLCIGRYVFVNTRFIEVGLISHRQIYLNLVLPSVNYVSLHTKL